jgi:hypothetical protein
MLAECSSFISRGSIHILCVMCRLFIMGMHGLHMIFLEFKLLFSYRLTCIYIYAC